MLKRRHWLRYITNPVVVVTTLLMIKLYLARVVIFGDFHIGRWLFLGISSLMVIVLLVEIFATKRRFFWLMFVNGILTGVMFAAIMYHKYYGVIVTYRALAQVGQVFQVRASVMNLTDPYYVLMFADILVMSTLYFMRQPFQKWAITSNRMSSKFAIGLFVVFSLVSYSNIMMNTSIYNESVKAQKMGLINYEWYEIVSSFEGSAQGYFEVTQEQIDSLKQLDRSDRELTDRYRGIAAGRNVIVIQLESFQNFLINLTVDGQEITPNLNKLIEDSLYFPHIYQQIGQGNTSDAEFMLNTSLYIPPNGAASQVYGNKELPSLPKLLKEYGYESMTFHTNDIKFWNRDALYPALGIDQMYDDDFFGEDELIAFGASDDVLYEKTVSVLQNHAQTGGRFYANVISMSAHHPYHLPDTFADLKLDSEREQQLLGRYFISQHYADAALGHFLEQLKQAGLWENSLIFIYGDHLGLPMNSLEQVDLDWLKELNGRDYDFPDMLNIPLVISIPGALPFGEEIPHVGGHVDFLPTIAHLLDVSLEHQIHFGQNLIGNASNLLPERYYLPTGSFINDEVVFIPKEGFDDGVWKPIVGSDISIPSINEQWRDDFSRAIQLLELSDVYVESLPER